MASTDQLRALSRYGLVGVATNLAGYLAYLGLTELGVEPKLSLTAVYVVAVTTSYLLNRSWTFSYRGSSARSIVRYVVAQVSGYLLSIAVLVVFVDVLRYPHQIVQATSVFVVAVYLFAVMRLFVFPRTTQPEQAR